MAVLGDRPILHYDTLTESREHLPEVIDAAQGGLMVCMRRGRSRKHAQDGPVSVVKTAVLRNILETLVAVDSEYEPSDGLYTVAVTGYPLATEGESWSAAVGELVDDIRVYCDDWVSRLRHAPNHEGNVPLVYMAQAMTDAELHEWLMKRVGG